MNTRPFTELSGLVEALCGCTFATQEQTRINYFINRRARRAYAESEFWPRFYVVGEERVVSSTGLLPDEQAGLSDIGTVLRIHGTAPFLTRGAVEYADFYKATSGTQITGYQAAEISSYEGANFSLVLAGDTNPAIDGVVLLYAGQDSNLRDFWSSTGELSYPGGYWYYMEWTDALKWNLTWNFPGLDPLTRGWSSTDLSVDVESPLDVETWVGTGSDTGVPTVTRETLYSAFVTYKAALSSTYGTADGEESDFPEEWFDYAAHGAYADWLRSEAQQDRAALAEQEADAILMQELEKIGRQGGGSVYTRVVTNQNTQWR